MGDLTKVSHVLDSREVAKMVGKKHGILPVIEQNQQPV